MSYKIPIGPYHPAMEEPYRIEVTCDGETVRDADLLVKFNFRGIEWLAEKRNYVQAVALMERVCGICSNLHSLTFCRSIEQLAGVEVPERAQYIRVVVAELERITSHTLWAGIAADVMGFQTLFMSCFALREHAMDILESLSGNRVNYSMNCIGGVNKDIGDAEAVAAVARHVEKETRQTLIPVFTTDRTIRARASGVGVLTEEQAKAWGAVGPTARASGVAEDIRKASPYAAYGRLEFEVPVAREGDVLARVVVRLLEIVESCRLIEQALAQMPAGPLRGSDFVAVPKGETVARSEAPRGECFYFVASDGSEKPVRVKVRTPSFMNIPLVRLMVRGANLADVPLIQASVDPCVSCTGR
ncbi:MAG: nickel-dependent hydrogenase large subunit [Acidobacteriota bacterium]